MSLFEIRNVNSNLIFCTLKTSPSYNIYIIHSASAEVNKKNVSSRKYSFKKAI